MDELVIAVDFDGTLCEHAFPEIGPPKEKVIAKVRELQARGHRIVLWTCREGEPLEEAVAWCESQGIRLDRVNENYYPVLDFATHKIVADIYLDDKAVHPDELEALTL